MYATSSPHVSARPAGWIWMDPLAGSVGAFVIASWSYGLARDTGAILLDMNPDRSMADKLRQLIEGEGDKIEDLHLWRVGPGHLEADRHPLLRRAIRCWGGSPPSSEPPQDDDARKTRNRAAQAERHQGDRTGDESRDYANGTFDAQPDQG